MLSSFLVSNFRGDLLLRRDYRGDVRRKDVKSWLTKVVVVRGVRETPPLWSPDADKSVHFLTLPLSELIFCAVCVGGDFNVALVFTILNKLAESLKHFLGDLTQTALETNICTVLSLLDEAIDFGVPQLLDRETLKPVLLPSIKDTADNLTQDQLRQITTQVTGACSWRQINIKYRRNEVYIDVLESVNCLISLSGQVLRTEVAGQVIVKCLLSGMPECKFAINDKLGGAQTKLAATQQGVTLEDVRFHQCVRPSAVADAAAGKAISFIPPDGVFQLMMYRTTITNSIPFKITPLIQQSGYRVEASIRLRSAFPPDHHAVNVLLTFPLPSSTARTKINTCSAGKAKFIAAQFALHWTIRRFQGNHEHTLAVEIDLAPEAVAAAKSGVSEWIGRGKAPLSLDFELPMYTASGLKVRFLKIQERSGYKALKWIRYVTKAGMYNRRI